MPLASMEPVSFTDLPKPFLHSLLNTLEPDTKVILRSCSKNVLGLVDELSNSLTCYVKEVQGVTILKVVYILSGLSAGITSLLLPELKLVPDVTFPSGAFSRLEHLVINYRLSKLCQGLAAAAGPSLRTVSVVPGRAWACHGGHWQAKLSQMLQVLQGVPSLQSLHLNFHCTEAIAQLIAQLHQLKALQLSLRRHGRTTPYPEYLFDHNLWNIALEPLTALTSLSLNLPILLSPTTAEQLHWPKTLHVLEIRAQHSDAKSESKSGAVSGFAAAQLLLHHLPALPQLTRLEVQAYSPNDWFVGPGLQLSKPASNALGQLLQLRSLSLVVGHWQLSLQQLQPLSSCEHLTELVLSELVMGFSDEAIDDQMGSTLTPEESAAVAAGVAAAGVAAYHHQQQQQQQQQEAGYLYPMSPGSSSNSNGATVVSINGHDLRVPLLPKLESLHCSTLWWRLPLVVLAPCLKDVAYKRLRNLGYGSFVLPDLQDWEDEQFPPVFEGLLQAGNAAAVGAAAAEGVPLDAAPLGDLLGAMLAPQGGFHPHNQHHDHIPIDNNVMNNDGAVGAQQQAAAVGAAVANAPELLALHQDIEMLLAFDDNLEPLDAAQQPTLQHWVQAEQEIDAAHDTADGAAHGAAHDAAHDAAHGAAHDAAHDAGGVHIDDAAAAEAAGDDAQFVHELLEAMDAQMMQHAGAAQQDLHDLHQQEQQPLAQWQQQQQQPSAAAAAAVSAPVLSDAPASRAYGDVLRGQRCLDSLDVCVTALCKIMHSSSSPLAHLKSLKLHMLGEVRLPAGGLPTLPQLTALEFYLPDERNWDANYNDYEDIALWQNQRNVRSIKIHGTFHAGGFFAPGHLDCAHRSMPLVQQLHFANCGDLHTDRLQQVIDSMWAPLVLVEACGASSSNSSAVAAAAAAQGANAHASAAAAAAALAALAAPPEEELMLGIEQHAAEEHVFPLLDTLQAASSSGTVSSSESSSAAAEAAGEVSSLLLSAGELSGEPQLVSKLLVRYMAVDAAAHGVELKWLDRPAHWRVWLT